MYHFSNDWFEAQRPVHELFLPKLQQPCRILEIGAYEGRSTVYFSQFLTHEDSQLHVIDSFCCKDETSPVYPQLFDIFSQNIRLAPHSDRITVHRGFSNEILPELLMHKQEFDYIVIDGSHRVQDILFDAVLCFSLLKQGGLLFFDDYLGGDRSKMSTLGIPRMAIDSFLLCMTNEVHTEYQDYHMVVRKVNGADNQAEKVV